ncbi:pyridine nucleotide-disulfide oxidoreductase domain-containing protein [Trichoderma breve]|uniref:NADPH:adrenodoxin oxidoreductase, mitochondrial n=1 Tax=Trichoderma breve TaxID=2034170 RepID=A0A9W9ED80_9HYPO|nr:pyridine nucleotide-disulfide oxidoreductase domain-containing protein [Trichoderma breve]KAJ4864501.1 pyridine nucleotide-disulfide oxidoreductase domain-containing protein [Trichoderma breve]
MILTLPRRAAWTRRNLFLRGSVRNYSVSPCLSRQADAPFRMAVVGSGPAGFYTAYRVMSKLPQARVDMYEALPVPFGLVRHGVAPDHPEVKNCKDKFDEVASSPNFTFVLMSHYDSVVFAYGAAEDKKLHIPGEASLKGIYSAREFVGWYNGHPDCGQHEPDLSRAEEAVIIGQGNVALDVARILLEDVDVLRKTDISDRALAQLAQSRIKRVHVVGRRGPMQAAFTIKEVRELMKLSGVAFHGADNSLIPAALDTLPRATKRLMEVIRKGTSASVSETPKSWSLDNCLSPKAFIEDRRNPSLVGSTEFYVTKLDDPFNPRSSVARTDETVTLPSDIAFRSVGYKSVALPGFTEVGIQFDEKRGIITNDGLGRATQSSTDLVEPAGTHPPALPGVYCSGWVKRGPTGVIASTMSDAFITGDAVVHDWLSGAPFLGRSGNGTAEGWEAIRADVGAQADEVVTWDQWRQIDQAETAQGLTRGKPREKFTSIRDMLSSIK